MFMSRKQREYSYDDWKKAMDLHNKYKLGPTKISRILGISEDTIRGWLYHGMIPPAAKWKAEPSKELAYIIGTIQGDGSVTKNETNHEYIIQLGVIDKEFAITYSKAISKLLNKKYHKPRWNKKWKKYWVRYNSKAFFIWYKKTEKQGLEGFKEYIEYNKNTVRYYLRGLFDSDGSNSGNKRIYLLNSKERLLKYVQYLLKKYFDVKATGPYLKKKAGATVIIKGIERNINYNHYMIEISRKKHVQKFLEEIGFSIVRKQLGLKKHEKVLVEGRYVKPYRLVELGLFRLPFSNTE